MSVVGILFRFIKNSANQLYSVKKDFHCCVIFTLVRFYILLYFTNARKNATVEIHPNLNNNPRLLCKAPGPRGKAKVIRVKI